jgi:hypothetical protein
MSWHDEIFSKGNTNQVYLVSTIKGERVAMGVTAAGRDAEDGNNRRGSTPTSPRLLTRSSPNRGSVLIHFNQYFIKRVPYCSERETTLEILETGHVSCWPCLPSPHQFDKRHPGASATPLLPACSTARADTEKVGQAASFSTHLALGPGGESTFCELRRRSAPCGRYWRFTPSTRIRRSSARTGRSQQVVDSAELK